MVELWLLLVSEGPWALYLSALGVLSADRQGRLLRVDSAFHSWQPRILDWMETDTLPKCPGGVEC